MKIEKTEHISRKDIDFEKFRAIHYELNISCDCPVVGQVGFHALVSRTGQRSVQLIRSSHSYLAKFV